MIDLTYTDTEFTATRDGITLKGSVTLEKRYPVRTLRWYAQSAVAGRVLARTDDQSPEVRDEIVRELFGRAFRQTNTQ